MTLSIGSHHIDLTLHCQSNSMSLSTSHLIYLIWNLVDINWCWLISVKAETKLAMERPQEALPYLDEAIAIAAEYPDDEFGRSILGTYGEMRKELGVASGE